MPTHAHTSMPHSLGSPEGVISKKNVSQMEMFSSYLRQLGASCPARFQQGQIPARPQPLTLQEVSWVQRCVVYRRRGGGREETWQV